LSITGNQLGTCSDPLPDLTEFFDEVVENLGDGVSLRSARVKATGDTTPSGVFHKFVWSRASRGRTYDEIVEDVRAHPDNIGERYEEQNRLEEEIKRSYDKWKDQSVLDPTNPMATARVLVDAKYTTEDGDHTLHRHRGAFWRWTGSCYQLV